MQHEEGKSKLSRQATNAERALAGLALRSTEGAEAVFSVLKDSDFVDPLAAKSIVSTRLCLDSFRTVQEAVILDSAGISAEDAEELFSKSKGLSIERVEDLAKPILEASKRRAISAALSNAAASIRSGDTPEAVMAELEDAVFKAERTTSVEVDGHKISTGVVDEAISNWRHGTKKNFIPTHLEALNKIILGLAPKLYVVGGRPGMGKSAFSQDLMDSVVLGNADLKYGGVFFSLEMSREEVIQRCVAKLARVRTRDMDDGTLDVEKATRLYDAPRRIPIDAYVVEDRAYRLEEILRKAKYYHSKMARNGISLKIVVIDYAGLVQTGGEKGVSKIAREAKMLSRQLDCAVLLLTQLNRKVEDSTRKDKTPQVADIRGDDGGGSLEQDADVILFPFRPYVYNPEESESFAQIVVAKQRSGPLGSASVRFHPETAHFYEKEHCSKVWGDSIKQHYTEVARAQSQVQVQPERSQAWVRESSAERGPGVPEEAWDSVLETELW